MKVDPKSQVSKRIAQAFADASEKTGASFDYLLKTAQRESSLRPEMKAKASTASGLYQFVDQTWLSMMKTEGPSLGLSHYASAITKEKSGTYSVVDPALRKEILDLRSDPLVSSVMAGKYAKQNAVALAKATGQTPTEQDLYVAHVLGASGGARLINLVKSNPNASAIDAFPRASAANPPLFRKPNGTARTAAELYAVLGKSHAARPIPTDVVAERIAAGFLTLKGLNAVKTSPAVAEALKSRVAMAGANLPDAKPEPKPQTFTALPAAAIEGAPLPTVSATQTQPVKVSSANALAIQAPMVDHAHQGWRAKAATDAFTALVRDGAPQVAGPPTEQVETASDGVLIGSRVVFGPEAQHSPSARFDRQLPAAYRATNELAGLPSRFSPLGADPAGALPPASVQAVGQLQPDNSTQRPSRFATSERRIAAIEAAPIATGATPSAVSASIPASTKARPLNIMPPVSDNPKRGDNKLAVNALPGTEAAPKAAATGAPLDLTALMRWVR